MDKTDREKYLRLKQLRKMRAQRLIGHRCTPVYRGAGHAYAYCGRCGRVMTQYSQRAHDIAETVKQIAMAQVKGGSDDRPDSQNI